MKKFLRISVCASICAALLFVPCDVNGASVGNLGSCVHEHATRNAIVGGAYVEYHDCSPTCPSGPCGCPGVQGSHNGVCNTCSHSVNSHATGSCTAQQTCPYSGTESKVLSSKMTLEGVYVKKIILEGSQVFKLTLENVDVYWYRR